MTGGHGEGEKGSRRGWGGTNIGAPQLLHCLQADRVELRSQVQAEVQALEAAGSGVVGHWAHGTVARIRRAWGGAASWHVTAVGNRGGMALRSRWSMTRRKWARLVGTV